MLASAGQVLDQSFPEPYRQTRDRLRFHYHVQHLMPHRRFQRTLRPQHGRRL
jgi:hypothetical protein